MVMSWYYCVGCIFLGLQYLNILWLASFMRQLRLIRLC